MGHQESFLYCEDFNYLLDKINTLGEDYFKERFIKVVEVVTLDRDLEFDFLSSMCLPSQKRKFKAGTKFIWITGDRQYQRRLYDDGLLIGLFGNNRDEKTIEMFYIERMSDKLFNYFNEDGELKERLNPEKDWLFTWENFKFRGDECKMKYITSNFENYIRKGVYFLSRKNTLYSYFIEEVKNDNVIVTTIGEFGKTDMQHILTKEEFFEVVQAIIVI